MAIRLRKDRNNYKAEIRREKRRLDFTKGADPWCRPRSAWWKDGRQPKRDSQRSKAYAAEREVRKLIDQKTFTDIAHVARYVRDTMEAVWFQRRWPDFHEVAVQYVPGSSKCRAWSWKSLNSDHAIGGVIEMSTWGIGTRGEHGGELIVLHELAHCLTPNDAHGRRWARVFLELVRYRMGEETYRLLRDAFRKHRVKYHPRRTAQARRREAA